MKQALAVIEAWKQYRSGSRRAEALRGVTLSVSKGEIHALVGPSGSGKSTLLHAICGVVNLDRGEILVHSTPVTGLRPADRFLGVVFQNLGLYPHLSTIDNVAFPLRARGLRVRDARSRAGEILELLRIAELASERPGNLSGGQRQRVAIGRALAGAKEILLLDEPFSDLDSRLRSDLRSELLRLRSRLSLSILLITHDRADCVGLADAVSVLNEGKVVDGGAVAEVISTPRCLISADFLREDDSNLLSGLARGSRVRLPEVGDFYMEGPGLPENHDTPVAVVAGAHQVRLAARPGGRLTVTRIVARRDGEVVLVQGDNVLLWSLVTGGTPGLGTEHEVVELRSAAVFGKEDGLPIGRLGKRLAAKTG